MTIAKLCLLAAVMLTIAAIAPTKLGVRGNTATLIRATPGFTRKGCGHAWRARISMNIRRFLFSPLCQAGKRSCAVSASSTVYAAVKATLYSARAFSADTRPVADVAGNQHRIAGGRVTHAGTARKLQDQPVAVGNHLKSLGAKQRTGS